MSRMHHSSQLRASPALRYRSGSPTGPLRHRARRPLGSCLTIRTCPFTNLAISRGPITCENRPRFTAEGVAESLVRITRVLDTCSSSSSRRAAVCEHFAASIPPSFRRLHNAPNCGAWLRTQLRATFPRRSAARADGRRGGGAARAWHIPADLQPTVCVYFTADGGGLVRSSLFRARDSE
jgi:hypothetical protein